MTEQPINIIEVNYVAPCPTIKGEIFHHYESLLSLANEACSRKEFELPVILGSCACEMLMERTFILLFSYNKIEHSVKAQREYNNITNPKNRKLYTFLSKDDIAVTYKNWSKLCEHYKRRNKVAHRGTKMSLEDVNESLASISGFMEHVGKVLNSLQLNENTGV